MDVQEEEEDGLIGAGGGIAVTTAAPVIAPAAAVDEGSSLLSHDEQQEAYFADPTANGAAPGMASRLIMHHPCCSSVLDATCMHLQLWLAYCTAVVSAEAGIPLLVVPSQQPQKLQVPFLLHIHAPPLRPSKCVLEREPGLQEQQLQCLLDVQTSSNILANFP